MIKELEEITPLRSNDDPSDILYSEIQEAIRILKRNKSPGSDRIIAETFQVGEERWALEIHKLCNKAWHGGIIPESLNKSILVAIPKKGD